MRNRSLITVCAGSMLAMMVAAGCATYNPEVYKECIKQNPGASHKCDQHLPKK
jgi:hypothetical protein